MDRKYHHKIKHILDSWWTKERRNISYVFSDTNNEIEFNLPNLVNTGCDESYNYGLYCKNGAMIKYWLSEPKFSKVKWFIRGMDDAYIHLENLHYLTKQYDPSKPIIIGERYCYWSGHDYPNGGPGIILSRAAIENFNWEMWEHSLKVQTGKIFDDVIWGDYIHYANITFIHHHGITQEPVEENDHQQLFNYMMDQKNKSWPLSFRPTMIHQRGSIHLMPWLHQKLHELSYLPIHPDAYDPPLCYCPKDKNVHQKCAWNQKYAESSCHWSSQTLICLGPGPYINYKLTS